ncbi:MAG: bifunctional 2-polyprenyl-6-hydroxyphenol methylase/3-demethylubiquinol 3-O-methyltransferase UbiG [Rhodospirillaceae bacterium]|nr:bifunctional 2-polyprenyl-6-hydroxyphenol methylase/3-demethylubiquinol 3-O-methyltransferase UbiG [Rhodospirillaceae bacterium]
MPRHAAETAARTPQPDTGRPRSASVDPADIARFAALADEWWDPAGKMRELHRMNPLRIGFIRDHVAAAHRRDALSHRPLAGLKILDVGCGGGLSSEPLARLGAEVTGIDAAAEGIGVARLHAGERDLAIDYRQSSAEELADTGATFDAVVALEIVEHVADVDSFLAALGRLARPGAPLVMSTLNRTAKSFALGIVAAEYVLRIVPRGTHSWRQFLKPSELARGLRRHGFVVEAAKGMVFSPTTADWALSDRDLDVNYLMAAAKAAA